MAHPVIEIELRPRAAFRAFLRRSTRWACLVAHRRAGKTVACLMDLLARAIKDDRPAALYVYVAPTAAQAKDVAWTYLKDYVLAIPGAQVRETDLTAILPRGQRIRLYGAERYDRLRGLRLDGAVIDEAGDIDPRAWPEVIRPALADRGGWATFIGTPKGRNAFYQVYQRAQADPAWHCELLRASETDVLPEAELADARRMMTPEQYAQEFEGSFDAAVRGAYYAREIEAAEVEGRVRAVPHDPAADVFAAWDLGIGDATALWVGQAIGEELRWLAYYENAGAPLAHYVDWLKALPYPVRRCLLPHDARARELQTGQSRVSFLEARGFACAVASRHGVDDGINAVRLKLPKMWFNADDPGMARGLDCLRMYRAEYDDRRAVLKPAPVHDWSSHGADALRCAVMGLPGLAQTRPPRHKRVWTV